MLTMKPPPRLRNRASMTPADKKTTNPSFDLQALVTDNTVVSIFLNMGPPLALRFVKRKGTLFLQIRAVRFAKGIVHVADCNWVDIELHEKNLPIAGALPTAPK